MLVEEELARFSPEKDTLLTVGVFDGVHLGHKYLISKLLEQAREKGLLAGAVTFGQLPEELLAPRKRLPQLTDIKTRTALLKAAGVDFIVPLSFTRELASLTARQFIEMLQKHLRMRGLVIGSDFALGKEREGDTGALEKLGREMGFTVTVVPPLVLNGNIVSSTAVRKALAGGDMSKVHEMAGRYFSLEGQVVAGAGRGTGLGFPTANLDVKPGHALPPDGVYAGRAHINGNVYQSLANIGKNPTFDATERTIEAFLVDYEGDLYGRDVTIDFIARLRGEQKFENAEALKGQVAEDVRQGREILRAISEN